MIGKEHGAGASLKGRIPLSGQPAHRIPLLSQRCMQYHNQEFPMRILVDMSATLIHHGHVRLLKKAKELGTVVVALTTDEELQA